MILVITPLMLIVVSCIPRTSSLSRPRKALGGSKDELHIMWKKGLMEQVAFRPIPKGYGTVRSPHLLWQPGRAPWSKELFEDMGKELSVSVLGK